MKKFAIALLGATMVLGAVSPSVAAKTEKAEKVKIDIAAPPAGKGQVVFYRTGGQGFALGCQVNEHGERVSALGAGKYFVQVTEPGEHTYMVSSEAKDVLTLEVEPDETEYVRCKIKMGIMVGRPNLEPSSQVDFDSLSHKLKMVDADDMGPKEKK